MLLCCLRRNVEASCHKHFVVSSSPAINKLRRLSATCVINLPWSVAAECIALGAWSVHSTRWSQILAEIAIFAARCYASAALAVMRCLSVCLSRSYILWKWINISSKIFSPPGSRTILVFHTKRHGNIPADTRTPHDVIGRTCVASGGKNVGRTFRFWP